MAVLDLIPVAFPKRVYLALLVCSLLQFESLAGGCEQNDLEALKEFAGNLIKGSIISSWSNDSICCQWDGVVCGNGTTAASPAGRVTKLILPNKGLKGTISPSLGRLDELRLLNLSWNFLGNGLPMEFSGLHNLEILDLSYNMLRRNVSEALLNLKAIQSINISSNLLNESLFDLGPFPNLHEFNVSNNSFTGLIGTQLCGSSVGVLVIDLSVNHFEGGLEGLHNCSRSLRRLHLDCNSFSGHLPEFLFAMSVLEELTIAENNFSGPISRKLSKISTLRNLIISGNHFTGLIPNIFRNFFQLETLIARSNALSGNLPSSLSLCSRLKVLDFQNNSLTGSIDLNFNSLPHLSTLDLASNHFIGPLPPSLASCRRLKILSLAKNELTGRIPEGFANFSVLSFLSLSNNSFVNLSAMLLVLQKCPNLTTIILARNFFGEALSKNISGFESLKILALGNCALRGQIPLWLLNCRKLQVLDLSWNRLDGNIPPWIGQMENLFYLDFSNNSLTGEIPKSLTLLKCLTSTNYSFSDTSNSIGVSLYVKRNQRANGLQYNQFSSFPPSILLSNNMITGIIWPEIGNLKQLHVLDLSRNNITGSIPRSIADMGDLEVLDLSFNSLYGSIPPSLKKLTFLSRFSVAYNHLQGAVPTEGQFLSFPNSSFEGNPQLCGLSHPCRGIGDVGGKPDIPSTSNNKSGRRRILGITISFVIVIALILTIVLLKSGRSGEDSGIDDLDEELCQSPGLSEAPGSSKLVLFQNSNCKDLTVADLLLSTNNFSEANIIGCGGFGLVYKAILPNNKRAAIKRLSGDCGQMEREFHAEVEALSRARHENLVSLQGYCQYGNDRLLIYSYMENGSLDYWLHERVDGEPIPKWDARLKIARGAGRGLAYLHKVCEPSIVHRDIKSSNILLDETFGAHLADFGLSRLLCPYDTHVTTDLVGTLGYIPPEYSQTLTATFKGDVYSFGVVLLELVTGRRPVDICKGKNCRDLVSWVFRMKSENRENEIVDSLIWDKDHEEEFLEFIGIACKCLDPDPRRRPSIDQVVLWLDNVRTHCSR